MKRHFKAVWAFTAAMLLISIAYTSTIAGSTTRSAVRKATQKGTAVSKKATGTFEVKLSPQTDEKAGDQAIGHLSIDKQFSGELAGSSKGQMLAAHTEVQDSAGYVALELVTATLNGRKGTFVLQHSGTMNKGTQTLSITVIPDSGTGELVGLTGKMSIEIRYGKHFYEFDYTLPEKEK